MTRLKSECLEKAFLTHDPAARLFCLSHGRHTVRRIKSNVLYHKKGYKTRLTDNLQKNRSKNADPLPAFFLAYVKINDDKRVVEKTGENPYCSIWRARNPAAVSADFCSTSPSVRSFEKMATAPIGSPLATIGAIV